MQIDLPGEKPIRPHDGPQEKFLGLPDEIQEAFYGGAVGGGKSWVLLMLPIMREFIKHPSFKGIIFRKTYPQLEEYLVPESKIIYKKFGGEYNETKHLWTFGSGATIRFGFIKTKDDARDHDGSQYNYIGWDELTHFDEWVYRYLFRSLRSGSKQLPAIVRSTSNPGNIGHSWVRSRFIEPDRNGYKKLWDPETKSHRIFIPSSMRDNPTLLENNPNYINILNTLPEAERKAKIEGDWWTFSGQVFTEWRDRHIDSEPAHALHVIEPFTIPSFWPKIVSIDWGFTHKASIHWHAVSPESRLFTYREYTCSKTPIEIWGSDVGRLSRTDENIVLSVMDPSAWKTESHGKTIAEQFMQASDMFVEQAINDRINGKLHYHEMLRWKERPAKYIPKEGYSQETCDRIFRLHGLKAEQEYKDMFLPQKPESNLPQWQIFGEACPELVRVIPLLVYDENKTEDVAKFDGDDSYDDTRYGIMGYRTYVEQANAGYKEFLERAKIDDKFKVSGDQTIYHRQMEILEARNRESVVPYNRFESRKRSKRQTYRAS